MFRFLLVDDNPDDATTLMFLIEHDFSGQAECEVASSLAAAIDWLTPERHQAFDAVLLDLNLDDSAGTDTYFQVRQYAPDIPIVIWSGRDDERELVDRLIEAGADHYLRKGASSSRQVFETLRDAAKRAARTVRLSGREMQSIEASEKATRAFLEQAHQSDPPGGMRRLSADAYAAQQGLLRQLIVDNALQRAEVAKLAAKLEKTEDVTDTLRTKAVTTEEAQRRLDADMDKLEKNHDKLRDLSLSNKTKLAGIAAAIAAVSFGAGERHQIIEYIAALFGG